MLIVCPHCATSYSVDAAALQSGRTVRCARCKEQWLAHPEEPAPAEAGMATTGSTSLTVLPHANAMVALPDAEVHPPEPPIVESPPLAGDWPDAEVSVMPGKELVATLPPRRDRRPAPRKVTASLRSRLFNVPLLCAAAGAMVVALLIWRGDVVRLLPQTANFYNALGLQVNLRGIAFKDLKISPEMVEGKPVLVIEGILVSQNKKPVDLPRLRFAVRDAKGQEVYAWNAILDQAVLQPGEKAPFRSRLASPPPQGHEIDVRFFNKRDLASGKA